MRSPQTTASLLVLLAAVALPASAVARPASEGWFTEAGIGAAGFLPGASEHAAIGPALSVRVGLDLFSWLSVGAHLGASTHEATVPPPPEGEYLQLYNASADGRLGFRLDTIALFVDGGAGVAMISSNVLAKVGVLDPGERFGLVFNAGAGAEYQLQNRHYAFGLAGEWMMWPQFDAVQAVSGRLYLRYTY